MYTDSRFDFLWGDPVALQLHARVLLHSSDTESLLPQSIATLRGGCS